MLKIFFVILLSVYWTALSVSHPLGNGRYVLYKTKLCCAYLYTKANKSNPENSQIIYAHRTAKNTTGHLRGS